jgi:hypothetical protein
MNFPSIITVEEEVRDGGLSRNDVAELAADVHTYIVEMRARVTKLERYAKELEEVEDSFTNQ